MGSPRRRRVLNVGCGPKTSGNLHPMFLSDLWSELRLDIDPEVEPDLTSSIIDMRSVLPSASIDAIWCSHSLEHLHSHEVDLALREFRRVLTADGFALVTCPDMAAVAHFLLANGIDALAYMSPSGPITPLDMMYGHGRSISNGRTYMAHNTGFTADRLGTRAIAAEFAEAWVVQGSSFDLWGFMLNPQTDHDQIREYIRQTELVMMFSDALTSV